MGLNINYNLYNNFDDYSGYIKDNIKTVNRSLQEFHINFLDTLTDLNHKITDLNIMESKVKHLQESSIIINEGVIIDFLVTIFKKVISIIKNIVKSFMSFIKYIFDAIKGNNTRNIEKISPQKKKTFVQLIESMYTEDRYIKAINMYDININDAITKLSDKYLYDLTSKLNYIESNYDDVINNNSDNNETLENIIDGLVDEALDYRAIFTRDVLGLNSNAILEKNELVSATTALILGNKSTFSITKDKVLDIINNPIDIKSISKELDSQRTILETYRDMLIDRSESIIEGIRMFNKPYNTEIRHFTNSSDNRLIAIYSGKSKMYTTFLNIINDAITIYTTKAKCIYIIDKQMSMILENVKNVVDNNKKNISIELEESSIYDKFIVDNSKMLLELSSVINISTDTLFENLLFTEAEGGNGIFSKIKDLIQRIIDSCAKFIGDIKNKITYRKNFYDKNLSNIKNKQIPDPDADIEDYIEFDIDSLLKPIDEILKPITQQDIDNNNFDIMISFNKFLRDGIRKMGGNPSNSSDGNDLDSISKNTDELLSDLRNLESKGKKLKAKDLKKNDICDDVQKIISNVDQISAKDKQSLENDKKLADQIEKLAASSNSNTQNTNQPNDSNDNNQSNNNSSESKNESSLLEVKINSDKPSSNGNQSKYLQKYISIKTKFVGTRMNNIMKAFKQYDQILTWVYKS